MTSGIEQPGPFEVPWRSTPARFRWWVVGCGCLVVAAFAVLLSAAPGPHLSVLIDERGFLALVALLILADLYPAVPWMRGRSAFGELILSSPVAIAALLAFGPHASVVFLVSGCAMNLARGKTWWRVLLNIFLYGLQGALCAWVFVLVTDRIGPVAPGSTATPWGLGLVTLLVVLVYELTNLVTVGISVALVGASSWRSHVTDWRPQVTGGVFALTAPVPAVLATQLPIMLPVLALASIAALEATNVISSRALQAGTDSLSGLANRAALMDGIRQRLALLRGPGEPVTLLLADLDGFKRVNDSFGHLTGDQVLTEVARRLESATRSGDLVARFGGDEFAVLLAPNSVPAGPDEVATRVRRAVAEPMAIDGRVLTIGVSIGMATTLAPGTTPQELLEEADTALYRAKAARALAGAGEGDLSRPTLEAAVTAGTGTASDHRAGARASGVSGAPPFAPVWSVTDAPTVGR